MLEQMKFLSITGPKDDIDRAIEQYISKFDIQLENALVELKSVKGLQSFNDINPYKEVYASAHKLLELYTEINTSTDAYMDIGRASDFIQKLDTEISKQNQALNKLSNKIKDADDKLSKIEQFIGLNYDMSSVLHFKFIKYRFGSFPKDYYDKFMKFVHDDISSFFYKCREIEDNIWGVYFVPASLADKVDSIYSSMHFERFFLPDEFDGTPLEASDSLKDDIEKYTLAANRIKRYISDILAKNKDEFALAYRSIHRYMENFDIRKLAALTKHNPANPHILFYIICGWMSSKDAESLKALVDKDENTFCFIEENHSNIFSSTPSKLKNLAIFRPFELFVEMYGLPDFGEIDPTPLIAVCYSLLFGFMFADVGQGGLLCIIGALIAYIKKSKAAAIVSICGFSSMIFGLLFGSVFGFEELIPALWLKPATTMQSLPLLGRLNTVFVISVALGAVIIVISMLLNIRNRFKKKEYGEALFDANGIAGLVFYTSLLSLITAFMLGKAILAGSILMIMFILPLILIFLKEPLTHLIERKAKLMPDDKAMFFIQGFFELFELLLGYFSNTLSFVRVGAFAISHAAMMEVVLMLAGASHNSSGSINWIVVILGNLFVCLMEGVIVAIQVLRLEYYEIFSRFYKGGGRAFVPYRRINAGR